MSFLYDRDYNVTGTVQSTFDFKPSYGTTVSFSAELATYTTVDNYLYTMPKALNHLQMAVQMPFENRKEEEARKISSFFENLRGTGYFTFTDPAQIYKPINLFCQNIQTDFIVNDLYNIQVSLNSDQASSLLNWNGLFVTGSSIKGDWATSTTYAKYDVVRYTGNSTFPSNTGNLYDSYYYCKEAHTSQSSVTPASVDTPRWTKDFFFQPTYQTQVGKETSVLKTELPYSFTKRTDFGLHANTLKSFRLDFKGISDTEARCILHFLINKQGYRKFQYKIPKIYNQYKIFFAPEWSHTFVYKNVNDISVTLVEDPLGRDVNETQNIVNDNLLLYLDAANPASYRSPSTTVYDISGNGNSGALENGTGFSSVNKGVFVFDGTNDLVRFSGSILNTTYSGKTIFVVARLVGGIPADSFRGFFGIGGSAAYRNFNFYLYYNTISQYLLHYSSGGSGTFSNVLTFSVGSWFSAAVTHSTSGLVSYYYNGLPAGSIGSQAFSQYLSGGDEFFGAADNYWSGNIATIAIYKRVLSATEILQNFNAVKERFRL